MITGAELVVLFIDENASGAPSALAESSELEYRCREESMATQAESTRS
jgi:hypothetical protein